MMLVVEIIRKSNLKDYYISINFAFAKINFVFAYDFISLCTFPKVHPSISLLLLLPVAKVYDGFCCTPL